MISGSTYYAKCHRLSKCTKMTIYQTNIGPTGIKGVSLVMHSNVWARIPELYLELSGIRGEREFLGRPISPSRSRNMQKLGFLMTECPPPERVPALILELSICKFVTNFFTCSCSPLKVHQRNSVDELSKECKRLMQPYLWYWIVGNVP